MDRENSLKIPTAKDLHSHSVTQDQIDSLDDIMRQAVQQELIAGGSFLVAHKGEIVFREAFGYAISKRSDHSLRTNCFRSHLSPSPLWQAW